MPRAEKLATRATGFAVLFGTAVILSGCVSTVDGRAVTASGSVPPAATGSATPTGSATATSVTPSAPAPRTPRSDSPVQDPGDH